MEPDLKYGLYAAPLPGLESAKQELVLKNEKDLALLEKRTSGSTILYGVEGGEGLLRGRWKARKQRDLQYRRKPSPTLWRLMLLFGDAGLLFVVVVIALSFSHQLAAQIAKDAPGIKNARVVWLCLGLVSWVLALNIGQPKNLGYISSRLKSPSYAMLALFLMNIFWVALSSLFLGIGFAGAARLELPILALTVPVLVIWRFFFAQVVSLQRFRPLAVIVGINPAGEAIAKELQSTQRPSARIMGYIGETSEERSYLNGLPVLGRSELRSLVYDREIDMIIVALDHNTHPELFKEAIEANHLGISVLPMTVVYENSTGKVPVEHVGDQWYVALPTGQMPSPFYICWKKALDLFCGLCGFLLLCVVTPIVALLILLDSPGPLFYSQERVGLRGKPFRIYKFRSMRTDAETKEKPVWAQTGDIRVTRVGRFLRATHLDELPQLFNILRGDMSLIGPRPERAAFIAELEKTVPFYRHRLTVKPGLTGWAQVKYHYGNTDNDALVKVQYDLYYIKHQSFVLDLAVILRTVTEVLSLRGT